MPLRGKRSSRTGSKASPTRKANNNSLQAISYGPCVNGASPSEASGTSRCCEKAGYINPDTPAVEEYGTDSCAVRCSKSCVITMSCVVCSAPASGQYFGATVCLPCKSFYIRCTKEGEPVFSNKCRGHCDVAKQARIRCQYCRYQKCLQAGMTRREKPEKIEPEEGQYLCQVCGDIANGIHFGVFTCEGCKKFFRRGLVENKTYHCKGSNACLINPRNRNMCRSCRYRKCVRVGMSRDAIKMGRPKKRELESDRDDRVSSVTDSSSSDMVEVKNFLTASTGEAREDVEMFEITDTIMNKALRTNDVSPVETKIKSEPTSHTSCASLSRGSPSGIDIRDSTLLLNQVINRLSTDQHTCPEGYPDSTSDLSEISNVTEASPGYETPDSESSVSASDDRVPSVEMMNADMERCDKSSVYAISREEIDSMLTLLEEFERPPISTDVADDPTRRRTGEPASEQETSLRYVQQLQDSSCFHMFSSSPISTNPGCLPAYNHKASQYCQQSNQQTLLPLQSANVSLPSDGDMTSLKRQIISENPSPIKRIKSEFPQYCPDSKPDSRAWNCVVMKSKCSGWPPPYTSAQGKITKDTNDTSNGHNPWSPDSTCSIWHNPSVSEITRAFEILNDKSYEAPQQDVKLNQFIVEQLDNLDCTVNDDTELETLMSPCPSTRPFWSPQFPDPKSAPVSRVPYLSMNHWREILDFLGPKTVTEVQQKLLQQVLESCMTERSSMEQLSDNTKMPYMLGDVIPPETTHDQAVPFA